MKNNFLTWVIQTASIPLGISIIILALLSFVESIEPVINVGYTYLILNIAFLIGVLALIRYTHRTKSEQVYAGIMLGFLVFRFLFSGLFAGIYIYKNNPVNKMFLIPFFIVYLIYTIYDIWLFIKLDPSNDSNE